MIIASLIISILTAAISFFWQDKNVIVVSYGLAIPLILLLPRFFYYLDIEVKNTVKFQWIKKIDFFAFFIIAFNSLGSLVLHDIDFQYDRILHFAVAFFGIIIFSILWLPVVRIKKKEIKKTSFLFSALILCFFGLFLWEGMQYSIDQIAGTGLFSDKSQSIQRDLLEDILFGLTGLASGMLYISRNFNKIISAIWK